jgi:hypothetical protein
MQSLFRGASEEGSRFKLCKFKVVVDLICRDPRPGLEIEGESLLLYLSTYFVAQQLRNVDFQVRVT